MIKGSRRNIANDSNYLEKEQTTTNFKHCLCWATDDADKISQRLEVQKFVEKKLQQKHEAEAIRT